MGEGGAATSPGTEMLIYTDGPSFAHVLMHELGHNLGLDHPFPGQPNRLSSMNTRLQTSTNGSGASEVLDYQRFNLPALNENALSEAPGIAAPAAARRFYILHWWREDPRMARRVARGRTDRLELQLAPPGAPADRRHLPRPAVGRRQRRRSADHPAGDRAEWPP